jgi:hypothetical protein
MFLLCSTMSYSYAQFLRRPESDSQAAAAVFARAPRLFHGWAPSSSMRPVITAAKLCRMETLARGARFCPTRPVFPSTPAEAGSSRNRRTR